MTKNWNSVYEARQLDFRVDARCSCGSSFDGEGDGACPVHKED